MTNGVPDGGPTVPPACTGHRCWFSESDKRRIVAEAVAPGANLSEVARRYGIAARVVFRWQQELAAPPGAVQITDAPGAPLSNKEQAP